MRAVTSHSLKCLYSLKSADRRLSTSSEYSCHVSHLPSPSRTSAMLNSKKLYYVVGHDNEMEKVAYIFQ